MIAGVSTYRVAEAAELLGVSDDTLRRWIEAGRVAAAPGRRREDPDRRAPTWPRWPSSWPTTPEAGHVSRAAAVSARNRLRGIVTAVKKDTVMAQVEMVCGPYRLVSLMSAEAADELGLEPGCGHRLRQVHQRRRGAAMRNRTVALALSLVATLALAGCGAGDSGAGGAAGSGTETGTLTVLAAASLTETFTTLAEDFEADHPGVTVKLAFDSSATLAEQVTQGAPADVLATADEDDHADRRRRRRHRRRPEVFATNHLDAGRAAGQPGRHHAVRRPRQARRELRRLRRHRALRQARRHGARRPRASPRSRPARRSTSRPCSSKVDLDEADAGLVYATDAVAAGDEVKAVDDPDVRREPQHATRSPRSSGAEEAAAGPGVGRPGALGAQGQQVLADAGFGKP